MKNKIFKLFLVLVMLISFTGCGKEKKKEVEKEPLVEVNNNDALIWEVKSDTSTVYLVGSIHVANDDTYPLQQKILDAFESSDAIAVEVDVVAMQQDSELMIEISNMMLYTDGTNLTNHISEDTLSKFNDYVAEYGISMLSSEQIELLYMYKPWVLYSLISNDMIEEAGFDSNSGIDVYFINKANEKGMEVIEVESARFQYDMMDSYSEELQEYLLKSLMTESREASIKELKDMLDIWENGDVLALETLLAGETTNLTEDELALYNEYNKAMIIDRNIAMADKVEELLKGDKDVFYMVGSAHMVGEDGIVQLLQERGYTVTKK